MDSTIIVSHLLTLTQATGILSLVAITIGGLLLAVAVYRLVTRF